MRVEIKPVRLYFHFQAANFSFSPTDGRRYSAEKCLLVFVIIPFGFESFEVKFLSVRSESEASVLDVSFLPPHKVLTVLPFSTVGI